MNVNISKRLKRGCVSLTNLYILFMFSLFLFVFHDYYFDMTPTKLHYFQVASIALLAGCLILTIIQWIGGKNASLSNIRNVVHRFSICDWAFLLLFLCHVCTCMISHYQMDSITGDEGRGMGLLFSFLLTSIYFLISRYYRKDDMAFPVLCISSGLVVGLAILNFFGIDPLHFFDQIKEVDIERFISTIGNVTFFAHLLCLVLPISICFFITSKGWKKTMYAFSCALGFIGLYISNLDGAYLGLFAFLLYFFYIQCVSYKKVMQLLQVCIIGLSCAILFWYLTILFEGHGRGFLNVSLYIVSSPITVLLWITSIGLYLYLYKHPDIDQHIPYKKIRTMILTIVSGILLLVVCVFLYFSIIDRTSDLGAMENYLRFSDRWGTGRGIAWNRLSTIYMEKFSILEKLFGSGLDTTRILMRNYYDLASYDNAHNEYLQYLVTTGFFGLFSYLCIYCSCLYRLLKHGKNSAIMLALAGALIAHGAQAITGLNQPITTPLVFIFFGIAEAYIRSINNTKKKDSLLSDTEINPS